ncbi:MAG: thiamine biosynthesis protein ThiS [Geobacteraceae bacterium GWB2_52_12]|nr:MAG: thiamine biosynthesis protein ThiS [Geobacteraceae bacterium GWB2_52_12]
MKITINGKETTLPENPDRTIDSLLEELDVSQRLYVTVELNGEVLDRPAFEAKPVSEGDIIEFLYFMGGGNATFAQSPR